MSSRIAPPLPNGSTHAGHAAIAGMGSHAPVSTNAPMHGGSVHSTPRDTTPVAHVANARSITSRKPAGVCSTGVSAGQATAWPKCSSHTLR
jgi:hypothetical protein